MTRSALEVRHRFHLHLPAAHPHAEKIPDGFYRTENRQEKLHALLPAHIG